MNACELVTFISTLSCAIANEFSTSDVALLAAVFTQLGDSLTTMLAVNESAEKCGCDMTQSLS